jgi:hypothetical protein
MRCARRPASTCEPDCISSGSNRARIVRWSIAPWYNCALSSASRLRVNERTDLDKVVGFERRAPQAYFPPLATSDKRDDLTILTGVPVPPECGRIREPASEQRLRKRAPVRHVSHTRRSAFIDYRRWQSRISIDTCSASTPLTITVVSGTTRVSHTRSVGSVVSHAATSATTANGIRMTRDAMSWLPS